MDSFLKNPLLEMEDEFIIQALRVFVQDIKLRPDETAEIVDKTAVQLTAYVIGRIKGGLT